MIEIQLENKKIIGNSYEEVVRKIRENSLVEDLDTEIDSYMKRVAERVNIWNGRNIRYDTAENFINDLNNYGLLKLLV